MRTLRAALRACAGAGVLAATVLVAAPASAHVTVDSPDASAGEFGKVVFRVPTESEAASTTKVTVDLPKDTPFAFVSTQSKPGWRVSMSKTKHDEPIKVGDSNLTETVSRVIWTARKGEGIAPGEFDEFALSVGPFPDEPGAALTFPTKQSYSDGSTAAWDQPTPASGKEPEHPAPTLTLASASDQPTGIAADAKAAGSDDGSASTMTTLVSIAALVVALAALGLSIVTRRARR